MILTNYRFTLQNSTLSPMANNVVIAGITNRLDSDTSQSEISLFLSLSNISTCTFLLGTMSTNSPIMIPRRIKSKTIIAGAY